MFKMWSHDGGYLTVEASVIIPVVLMVFVLLISYIIYFMDCGIAEGLMEEMTQSVAVCSEEEQQEQLQVANQNLKKELSSHVCMVKVQSAQITKSSSGLTSKVTMNLSVPGVGIVNIFGIKIFCYEGSYTCKTAMRINQIRRWIALEKAVD